MLQIDCVVLTGFLGSGKTTLLNTFLRTHQGQGTAVLVNEVGDIGIDDLVIAEVADNVLLLESGCLCCTLVGTLRETLLDLIAQSAQQGHELNRVIIETTGLAEPAPILHSLLGDKALTDVIQLSQVVVTVDAMQGIDQMLTHPECVRQIAAADLMVITKSDLASPAQRQQVLEGARKINPLARQVETRGETGISELLGNGCKDDRRNHEPSTVGVDAVSHESGIAVMSSATLTATPRLFQTTVSDTCGDDQSASPDVYLGQVRAYHQRVRTESFYIEGPVFWSGIAAWWNLLTSHYGKHLLRCKGLLRVRDTARPYAYIQAVSEFFHTPQYLDQWPATNPTPRVVCIGAEIDRSWLQSSLRALAISEGGLRPTTLEELDCVMQEKLNAY